MLRIFFVCCIVGSLALSSGCAGYRPGVSSLTFEVSGFGARGDGVTMDTVAFQHAIEAARQAGGATVRVPAGTYLVAPLNLASGLTLQLDRGAVVKFSADPNDYPIVDTRWEGEMRPARRAAMWADGCRDVAIVGAGVIDGQGAGWWQPIQQTRRPATADPTAIPVAGSWENDATLRRPPLLQFSNCSNVRVEGVTIQNSPFATVHLLFCDRATVRNARLLAPVDAPNTDAVVIDSSRDVLIEGCHAAVGADAFVLKSGKDEDGRRIARPTENVTIRHCTIAHASGGLAIGSEMSGGVRRVRISDCRVDGAGTGIIIKSIRGRGGVVEDVRINNITMTDVDCPFSITLRHRPTGAEPLSQRTPRFRNISLSAITARDAGRAGIIQGLEEMPVSALKFRELDITARYGISCSWADDIEFREVTMATDFGPAILRTDTTNLRLDNWIEATRPPASAPAATTQP